MKIGDKVSIVFEVTKTYEDKNGKTYSLSCEWDSSHTLNIPVSTEEQIMKHTQRSE